MQSQAKACKTEKDAQAARVKDSKKESRREAGGRVEGEHVQNPTNKLKITCRQF